MKGVGVFDLVLFGALFGGRRGRVVRNSESLDEEQPRNLYSRE